MEVRIKYSIFSENSIENNFLYTPNFYEIIFTSKVKGLKINDCILKQYYYNQK